MKNYNTFDMQGRLYSYSLEVKDTDNGEAISGEVTLEVDKEGNRATVKMFARPTFKNGKTNRTYGMLEDMMAGNYTTVVEDADNADWFGLTGNIDVSYFAPKDGGAKDVDELARSQKLRGSFLNQNRDHKYKNRWNLDMLITRVDDVDADEEKHTPHMVRVMGYAIDDYNERLNEVVFEARKEAAMNYILGLPVSYDAPYFVRVWGEMLKISRIVVHKNAFGDDETNEYDSFRWAINGMNPEAYEFGDESAISKETYDSYREALKEHKESKLDDNSGNNALAF